MTTNTTLLDGLLGLTQAPAPKPQRLAPRHFDGGRLAPTPGFELAVHPKTKVPYGFQLAAIESIIAEKRLLLGLQPGMGKTAIMQAVAADVAAKGGRTVCVVPPSLRIDPWAKDFAADYPHLRVAVIEGTKAKDLPDVDVVILGDAVLAKRAENVVAWAPRAILADEGHRYKSRTAGRSKALLHIADSLTDAIVVVATGTVAVNTAAEVYQPLRITGAANASAVSGGPSWTRFMSEWCITERVWTGNRYVEVAKGCVDAPGLRAKLLRHAMISVPREDVLDLPERTFAVRSLALNGAAAEYRRAEADFFGWLAETGDDKAVRRAAKAEAITKLMKLWALDGLAKAAPTAEYVASLVEQGEQVVVMAWHADVIQALWAALVAEKITVAVVKGGISSQDKADISAAFQAGQVQVLIGQIEAAGVGLTLHASCNIVFAQLSWSPGSFAQAADRIYRIGQHRPVTIHVLNGLGMVSERLWEVLQAKAQVVDAINTGRPTTVDPESVVSEVLAGFGW